MSHFPEIGSSFALIYLCCDIKKWLPASKKGVWPSFSLSLISFFDLSASDWVMEFDIDVPWLFFNYFFCFLRCFLGVELLKSIAEGSESILKSLWHHSDAIICCSAKVSALSHVNLISFFCLLGTLYAALWCRQIRRNFFRFVIRDFDSFSLFILVASLVLPSTEFLSSIIMQALPVFTFANQAGLDMLETTLVALQDITLEKIFDDHGKKNLCTEFPQIMQQVSIPLNVEKLNVAKKWLGGLVDVITVCLC